MEYLEAARFVNNWLWDSAAFGSERSTSGMPWADEYKMDAAKMVRDAVNRKTSERGAEPVQTTNTQITAALKVYEEYLQSIDGVYPTPSFRDYCKQRLNTSGAANRSERTA